MDFEAYYAGFNQALSRIARFVPDFLVVSIGFDTYVKDPLGDFVILSEDFKKLGRNLRQAGYPVMVCLEGGYDIHSLGDSATSFIEGLLDLSS